MREMWRDGLRELTVASVFFLPWPRRKAIERWLRGREEYRKLQLADWVLMSWGKSGRTWLRVMLSRFYQVKHGLGESELIGFDNLKRLNSAIPSSILGGVIFSPCRAAIYPPHPWPIPTSNWSTCSVMACPILLK